MGEVTILDELKALFDGLQVVDGEIDVTFEWVEWEEQDEARGPSVTADSSFDLEVSDIGGGAQAVVEDAVLRFGWFVQSRTAVWTSWRNEFVKAVLALIRGNEKGFAGGYFVEVTDVSGDRIYQPTGGSGPEVVVNQMDFVLTVRRHDVYG